MSNLVHNQQHKRYLEAKVLEMDQRMLGVVYMPKYIGQNILLFHTD